MKITDVTITVFTHPVPPVLRKRVSRRQETTLVEVSTDEGVSGYGMARANGGTSGTAIADYIVSTLRPLIVGEHPLSIEALWQKMWAQEKRNYVPVFAISAIDVALWDLAGKLSGIPVFRMLGGFRDTIPAYASSAFLDTLNEYIADAESVIDKGIRHYKIHPFQDFRKDLELSQEMADRFGATQTLMIDPQCVYSREEALAMGRALEDLDFAWYEEPLPQYDLDGYRELTRLLDIPVIGAESLPGCHFSAATVLTQNAVDMVECDVYWKGGITGVLKTAHLSESLGRKVVAHHAGSSLMNLANLHVFCAISNADFIEVLVPEEEYGYGLSEVPMVSSDGTMAPPDAPGIGAALDWDYITKNTVHKT